MNIDRREFLIGLLALTTVPVLGSFNLELPEDVAKAWDTLSEKPFVFQVDSQGILDDESYGQESMKHRDVYGIPQEIKNMEDLLYSLEWQPFAWVINGMYYGFVDALPKEEQENWIPEIDGNQGADDEESITKWSNYIGEKNFTSEVNNALQKWLEEDVIICDEEVFAEIPLYGGAYVFNFFDRESDLIDKLKISLVEGFYPGDNSQRAVLDMPIEEANKICKKEKLPIRFEIA